MVAHIVEELVLKLMKFEVLMEVLKMVGRPKSNKVKMQVVLAKELAEALEAISEATGVSKSNLVALAITEMTMLNKWQVSKEA